MADSIERIAGEMAACIDHGNGSLTVNSSRVIDWRDRLRALSPAGGGGRGCDWYEDEDTGSRIVDFDFASDHSRQLSLILKANGEVAYAAYINGTHMNGADAMTPEFYSAIRMLSASPQKSPTVGDWMMVPARLTGPMAYAMVERLGHPDSSPQDCWTATLAASPQQEPGAMTAESLAATWRARADDLADEMIPGTSNKEITLLRDLADELEAELVPTPADESGPSINSAETYSKPIADPIGQTLAGAGGVDLEQFREAVECFRLVSLGGKRDCERHNTHPHDFDRSLEKANRLLAIIDTATSAGTTGDGGGFRLPELPQPFDYCYEWDGPYGRRKFSSAPHNGRIPDKTTPLYTSDQMYVYASEAISTTRQASTADDAADALRYRWLRDNCEPCKQDTRMTQHAVIMTQWFDGRDICRMYPGKRPGVGIPSLDQAIDAARRAREVG